VASIDKRPNGRWRARWREYPSGPQRAQHFNRKIDAEHFLVDLQHRMLTGAYTPPSAGRISLRSYAEEWTSRRTWEPATHDRVERELRLHILPVLGDWPLASLRRSHIEEWAAGLPLAVSSARIVYETLAAMLTAAVEDQRIPRNPAKGAQVPFPTAPPFRPLEPTEIQALSRVLAPHVRTAAIVATGTGLRQGELFGLSHDRLDRRRQELVVDRQLWTPATGSPVLKAPKSRRSFRTIAVTERLLEVIDRHTEAYGTGEHRLLFHIEGRPVKRAVAATYMRRASKAAGTSATWHDFRHHHATVLLAAGVNPSKVADRLGHDLKTLLATYAHALPSDDERVRAVIDQALEGALP
jgi:integrase